MATFIAFILSDAACCCMSMVAGTVLKAIGRTLSLSENSRISWSLFLFSGLGIARLAMSKPVVRWLVWSKAVTPPSLRRLCSSTEGCVLEDVVSRIMMERICLGVFFFFLLFSLLTIGANSINSWQGKLQNSLWTLKTLLFGTIIFFSAFIDYEFFLSSYSTLAWICSFLFIVVQMVLLVDFAHSIAEYLLSASERAPENGKYFWALLVSTVSMLLGAIGLTVISFMNYTAPAPGRHGEHCGLNSFFLVFNLIACIISCLLSIHPEVQEANPDSGLLQASLVALYSTYLVWTALSSEPYASGCSAISKDTQAKYNAGGEAFGTVLTVISIVYSSLSNGSSNFMGYSEYEYDGPDDGSTLLEDEEKGAGEESEGWSRRVPRAERPDYSYAFFHFVFACSALYMSQVITDFEEVKLSKYISGGSWTAVWVAIGSGWLGVALYCWSLVAPILLPDRDFTR